MVSAALFLLAPVIAAAQLLTLPADVHEAQHLLRVAEDARATERGQREQLVAGLTHADVGVRMQATRALGRLEDAGFVPALVAALDDASLEVRVEAAHAVAQSAATPDAAKAASRHLRGRLDRETDGGVRGAIAASLGRLPYGAADERLAAAKTLEGLLAPESDATRTPSVFTLIGVARGAAALARRSAQQQVSCDPLQATLQRLMATGQEGGLAAAPIVAARVRRLAASALVACGALSSPTRQVMLTDEDAEVRRVAIGAVATDAATTEAMALAWMRDEAMIVRHSAAQRAGRRWTSLAERALADDSLHVRLAGIDALGEMRTCAPCAVLVAAPPSAGTWHVAAHALVALARTDAARGRAALTSVTESPIWQVRMYAARAAAELADVALLRDFARDPHPNVREAALTGLGLLKHRDSDDLRMEALESGDYQLVLTAARGLEGTPRKSDGQRSLLQALERLTRDRRETSRDPRVAILDRLDEVGDATVVEGLRPWTRDHDAVVASRVARLIEERTGRPTESIPTEGGAREALPTEDEIATLDGQQIALTMRGGGDVVIRLAAREAPTNVARFVRQVVQGAWDGLTFHRVEPGFVVQGGSPGANEYVGADLYTRDERGALSHVRGSVGISTRGRDTGDGQIFVNLVDNARLDHAYTVIGTVVAGMPLVDAMLEGATIERARLVER